MKLSEPYTIAYETIDSCSNFFIRCHTDEGFDGFGCAAPDLAITGETEESVERDFRLVIEPFLRGKNPFRYSFILEELRKVLPQSMSAMAMVDMMLFDIVAKKAGVPLYLYLGGYRNSIPTSITIGIMSIRETVEKAAYFARQGFRILKIKGGADVENDIARIMETRKVIGARIKIRFDANQGFSPEEAIHFVESTKSARLELLEQPTPRDNAEWLGKVCRHVNIPVMADESIMSLKDVYRYTKHDLMDMINIKLMKVGGIYEGMHINSSSKAANVEAMVGCMDESGLAIAAGLHFALSRPNIVYADLDGHLDLLGDPAGEAVILKQGVLYPTGKPGLGFNIPE